MLSVSCVTHALFVSCFGLNDRKGRCFKIATKEQLINEDIREKEIRVISADGEQLGIMSSAEALEKAYAADLDLVMISPTAKPPVCRIMDYGK